MQANCVEYFYTVAYNIPRLNGIIYKLKHGGVYIGRRYRACPNEVEFLERVIKGAGIPVTDKELFLRIYWYSNYLERGDW